VLEKLLVRFSAFLQPHNSQPTAMVLASLVGKMTAALTDGEGSLSLCF